MYPTIVGLMFAAKHVVICLHPYFFNLISWHHVSGGTYIHWWYSPYYGPCV